jgi:hypothetical protein
MKRGLSRSSSANPSWSQLAQLCLRGWLFCLCACADEPVAPGQVPDAAVTETRPALCAREVESSDVVRELFCAEAPPEISSLGELKRTLTKLALGVELNVPLAFDFFLGHSTSLSGHYVSSINPRAIMILAPGGAPVATFTRGVQQVELATLSRDRRERRFYLLRFEQACNARPEGCTPADLYTERAEEGWQALEVSDDEELKNTALDCRQCHQRARSQPLLLMRELVAPWTHFFEPISQEPGLRSQPGVLSTELTRDYVAAKGDELYAGVNADTLLPAGASLLQAIVGNQQPLVFSSQEILNERWPRDAEGKFPAEPQDSMR